MIRRMNRLIAAAVFGLVAGLTLASAADNPVIVQDCCTDGCCRKVCRPTTETKQVTTRCYDDTCEDFCLPRCSLIGGLFHHRSCCGDSGGGCASCEHHVRTRKFLIVRERTHEECVNKCVVEHEAPCAAPCCPASPCVQPAPAPVIIPPAPESAQQIIYVPGMPLTR